MLEYGTHKGYIVWSCWHGGDTYSGFVGCVVDLHLMDASQLTVHCPDGDYFAMNARVVVPDSLQLRYLDSLGAIFPGDVISTYAIRMNCGGDWVYLPDGSMDGLDEAMERANAKAKLLGKVEWPLDQFRLSKKTED